MSGETKATPRPWRWEPEGFDGLATGSKNSIGCDVMAGDPDQPLCVAADVRNEADAALIVRAVNAHEDTLQAMYEARALVSSVAERVGSHSAASLREVGRILSAAIALAEGRP